MPFLLSDYEKLDRLPVIYATDGEEFDDPQMGAKSIILDNLLADGAIQPVLAVFVDPRDPVTGRNRRYTELATNDDYVAFLVEDVENTRRLRDVLQAKGHPLEYRETLAGHSWSNWRSVLGDLLVYFFAK